MKISEKDAKRLAKTLTLLLFECAERGDLSAEIFAEALELLLLLEETGDAA